MRSGEPGFEHDPVIHRDGRIEKREKKLSKHLRDEYGHTPLSEEEWMIFEEERPDLIYIGTGQHGALPLTPGARRFLPSHTVLIAPTPEVLARMESKRGRLRRFFM